MVSRIIPFFCFESFPKYTPLIKGEYRTHYVTRAIINGCKLSYLVKNNRSWRKVICKYELCADINYICMSNTVY